MPKNWKEELVFTLLMVTFIVSCMVIYNIIVHQVVPNHISFKDFIGNCFVGFCIAFTLAFFIEFFVVRHIVAIIVFKVLKVNPQNNLALILSIAFVTMAIMCPLMSVMGTVLDLGWSGLNGLTYLDTLWKNIIFIIPINLLVAGPLSRKIFSKLYPSLENPHTIKTSELI